MVSVEEFIRELIKYLKANDKRAFNRIDRIIIAGICKDRVQYGFHHAHLYYDLTGNIEGAKRIILDYIKDCKEGR